jgi:hypothetical protein
MKVFAHIVYSGDDLSKVVPIAIALKAETGQTLYCVFNNFSDVDLRPFDSTYIVPALRFRVLRSVGNKKNLVVQINDTEQNVWGDTQFIRMFVAHWLDKLPRYLTIVTQTAIERTVANNWGIWEGYDSILLPTLAKQKEILDSNWTWFLPVRRRATEDQPNQYDPMIAVQSKMDFYNYLTTK